MSKGKDARRAARELANKVAHQERQIAKLTEELSHVNGRVVRNQHYHDLAELTGNASHAHAPHMHASGVSTAAGTPQHPGINLNVSNGETPKPRFRKTKIATGVAGGLLAMNVEPVRNGVTSTLSTVFRGVGSGAKEFGKELAAKTFASDPADPTQPPATDGTTTPKPEEKEKGLFANTFLGDMKFGTGSIVGAGLLAAIGAWIGDPMVAFGLALIGFGVGEYAKEALMKPETPATPKTTEPQKTGAAAQPTRAVGATTQAQELQAEEAPPSPGLAPEARGTIPANARTTSPAK